MESVKGPRKREGENPDLLSQRRPRRGIAVTNSSGGVVALDLSQFAYHLASGENETAWLR